MKFLSGEKDSKLRSRPRRLLSALGLSLVVTATLILIWMITTKYKKTFSANRTRLFESLFPRVYSLELDSLRSKLNFLSTCCGLLYSKLEFNSTIAPLISFGGMFALMSYLVLLSFKLNESHRQRARRYRRVSSCLWTRRKVY